MAGKLESERLVSFIKIADNNEAAGGLASNYRRMSVRNPLKKQLNDYVGFANLPNQVHRKSVKKGFQFTFMVVGESGLGKSTLVNTLWNSTLLPQKKSVPLSLDSPKTVSIQSYTADLIEDGVKLGLNIIDTPGFGDFVNNEESWKPILDDIESRFDLYLERESKANRSKMEDNRVHACLYFISPTGHAYVTTSTII
ncbi:Cell division control protein 3 [Basidiobolus ranarum]|uniref:Cell division control protein 3 n=1 Tax=Basidiobolus ranarum TaxID=34480 RepID=A0ABR2WIS7_9FUNG